MGAFLPDVDRGADEKWKSVCGSIGTEQNG